MAKQTKDGRDNGMMFGMVAPFGGKNGQPVKGTSDRMDISTAYEKGQGTVIPDPTGRIEIPLGTMKRGK